MPDNQNGHPCPPPPPGDNEGNIVNVNTCCDDAADGGGKTKEVVKTYVLNECEPEPKSCCFDVYLTKVGVTHNREAKRKAELMVTGYANEQSGVWPGMGCWAQVDPKWGWVNTNQKIGSFTVKEGQVMPVYLRGDIIEGGTYGEGTFELGSDSGQKDEWDADIVSFNLTCEHKKPIRTRIEVMGHDAKSANKKARVVLEFTAFPRAHGCC